jgi:hypothetical protein
MGIAGADDMDRKPQGLVSGRARINLKLVRCPRSLAPTLVVLHSMSLIPFAPFSELGRVPLKPDNR